MKRMSLSAAVALALVPLLVPLAARAEAKKPIAKPADPLKKEKLSEACSEDAKKLCKDVRPGDGRVLACLKEHHAKLSRSCGAFLSRGDNPGPAGKMPHGHKLGEGYGSLDNP